MLASFARRFGAAAIAAVAAFALITGAALAWTGHVQGKPSSFAAGGTDGYYVWHDDDGLHLRTTDSSGVFKYTGVMHTNGTFVDVNPVKLEADDKVEILDGGKTIRFDFVTAEGIDGIDFRVDGGTRVRFGLMRDGSRIDTSNVFLGEDSTHPAHNPFTIRRDGNDADGQPSATATPTATATAIS
jgi:hypothetical protein